MVRKKYSDLEKHIIKLFCPKKRFKFNNEDYEVIFSDKPTATEGECKTDCFIRARNLNTKNKFDIKISIKMKKDEKSLPLENKLKLERAQQIFGNELSEIKGSIIKLKDSFEKKIPKIEKLEEIKDLKKIPLGWMVDIFNFEDRDLSVPISVTKDQLKEIYQGFKSGDNKINAKVNNRTIENSGIPEYILFGDKNSLETPDDVIEQMVKIDKFFENVNEIIMVFKTLNFEFRDKAPKSCDIGGWDGDRPLAVYVNWEFKDKKLKNEIIYDEPLEKKGNEIGNQLCKHLKRILTKLDKSKKQITEYNNKYK